MPFKKITPSIGTLDIFIVRLLCYVYIKEYIKEDIKEYIKEKIKERYQREYQTTNKVRA
jgi:hypothetical protein